MTAHGISLADARKELGTKEVTFRASDFLSDEQQEQLAQANAKGAKTIKPYDEIDAFSAEVLARFGYDTWQAWQGGKISTHQMLRYIAAERARETRNILPLEAIMMLSMAGANHPGKNGKPPKSLASAQKILQNEQKKGA